MRIRASWATLIAALFVFCSMSAVQADVPTGTDVFATLQQTLDTRSAKAGDAVVMTVTGVLPADAPDAGALQGATIRGHVQQAYAATPTKKAYIGILFDTITLTDGRTFPYPAKIVALQKKKTFNAAQAAGEVLVGMVVGNMLFKTTMGSSAGGPLGAVGGAVYASQMAANFKIPSSSTVKMRTTDIIATVPHPQAPAGAMQPPPPMAPPPPPMAPPSPMPTH